MLPPSFRNSAQMRNKITKNTSAIDDSCACSPFFSSVEDPYSICCNPLTLFLSHAFFFFPAGFPTHIFFLLLLLNRCLNHGIFSHKRSKKLLDIVTERKRKQRTGGVTGGSSSSSKQKQISPTPPKKKKTKVKKEESVLRSVDI